MFEGLADLNPVPEFYIAFLGEKKFFWDAI
jgi:hypothetical protein